MQLTDKERDELIAYREDVADRESAHRLAAEGAAAAVRDALRNITNMDFGLAKFVLENLLEGGLPNDHGGPVTHYPLFDEALEKLRERRGTRA